MTHFGGTFPGIRHGTRPGGWPDLFGVQQYIDLALMGNDLGCKRTPYLGTLVLTTINLDYYIYHDLLWLVNGPAIDGRVSERETSSLSYFHRAFGQARPLITTAPPWRSSDHYSLALSQRERPRGPCLAGQTWKGATVWKLFAPVGLAQVDSTQTLTIAIIIFIIMQS